MSEPRDFSATDLRALRVRAKTEIRRQLRAVRRVLPREACAERSQRACERLAALPELERASTVVAYLAMHKELDPSALLAHARAAGKVVGVPRVDDELLTLHVYGADDELEESGYGMNEPLASTPRIEPASVDVIIVPALALDPRGHRVGYGRGFYDRLLPTLGRAFKIGIAYDFQLIAEAPNDEHDVALDCIVTDTRVLRIGVDGS